MTTGSDWQDQVGRSWARAYQQTDRSFAGLTEHLLARIGLHAGTALLDVGCGAGELSLALARARPRARIVGLDVSPDLITSAQQRAGAREQIQFIQCDAATWREPEFEPDLLVSRHGVMFFSDPAAAFANLDSLASAQAPFVFSCFRNPRENLWAAGLAELLQIPQSDPQAPGPFAFAEPKRVEAYLQAGNWHDVDFEPVDFAWIAGAGENPVEDALEFLKTIGPGAPVLRALAGADLARAEDRIRRWLESNRSGDLVAFGAAAWIVTAKADRRIRNR
jgi:SAM-dependent methyltransferase